VRAPVFPLLVLISCGPLTPPATVKPPQGLVCDRVIIPPVSLGETLESATAGDCVILPSGTYSGAFVLPEDVSLAGADRATVILTGGDPVLTVRGGARTLVQGLRILPSGGGGIAIEPGPARLVGVTVTQSQKSALTATCTRADCADREVVLTDCELTQSAVGLRVKGARVRVEGGRIAEQAGRSLSAGSGVVASEGASVTMHGVTVEGNENIGVLLDGAATRATIDACVVKDNLGRGIWAQGQAADAGVVTVTVSGGEVSGNSLVGIGALESTGLLVRGVLVKDTLAVRVPIDIARSEDVGDGIGLFDGTTSATLENVTLQGNARAQVLAHGCGPDVKVLTPSLSGGRFRVVVQGASAPVQVEPLLVDDAGVELLVQSNSIVLQP
jgi:nitrous oxidase accessory protein NosD